MLEVFIPDQTMSYSSQGNCWVHSLINEVQDGELKSDNLCVLWQQTIVLNECGCAYVQSVCVCVSVGGVFISVRLSENMVVIGL